MSSTTRVRFAPSPTGYLHIGGARTALFNWLLARAEDGVFVLRIEDTDRTRHVDDSLDKILADMRWLGLQWDEGPEVGGAHGPYFQSARLDVYTAHCERLLAEGKAYYAFDTPEELDAMRSAAREAKQTFKYPRPETLPSAEDAERARAAGRPVAVRFAAPRDDVVVHDAILGDVTVQAAELEDFVIRKSDGYPTYHFACVVDDALMQITHVIRGSEHLNNTPKHILLQQALGVATPVYMHVPIIFNMSGSKMSKRDKDKAIKKGEVPPEIEVHDFRRAGYLPEALLNFISLLGWSPPEGVEQIDLQETLACFNPQRIGKTNAKFDREKLLAFNTDWVARVTPERLNAAFRDFLEVNDSPLATQDDATLAKMLQVCAGFRTFPDVVTKAGFIYAEDDSIEYDSAAVQKVLAKGDGAGYTVLERLRPVLEGVEDWTAPALDDLFKSLAEEWAIGFGKLAQPIRVALSGGTISPSITETVALVGKQSVLKRLDRTLALR